MFSKKIKKKCSSGKKTLSAILIFSSVIDWIKPSYSCFFSNKAVHENSSSYNWKKLKTVKGETKRKTATLQGKTNKEAK